MFDNLDTIIKYAGWAIALISLIIILNKNFDQAPKLIDESEYIGENGAWSLYECFDGRQIKITFKKETNQYMTEEGFTSSKRKAALKACD